MHMLNFAEGILAYIRVLRKIVRGVIKDRVNVHYSYRLELEVGSLNKLIWKTSEIIFCGTYSRTRKQNLYASILNTVDCFMFIIKKPPVARSSRLSSAGA